MQTRLPPQLLDTPLGRKADAILRACVHCGFCNATCPTYQLLGDELDGPRGRIYQIKQMLEGEPVSAKTRLHLDRCLTCRNCETTCPSGVRYHELLDIGRELIEEKAPRPLAERVKRHALLTLLPNTDRFARTMKLARLAAPLLPEALRRKLPEETAIQPLPQPASHPRKMLLLDGCVQPVLKGGINRHLVTILDRLGIETIIAPESGCCGAMAQHMGDSKLAKRQMRANIDAWWPHIEAGAEAIISTASGCGLMLKEYADLLADDPRYAEQAARVSALARDVVEVLEREDLAPFRAAMPTTVAFHPPCTLQHGQKLAGRVEALLSSLGFRLTPIRDSHLCCGSAGTYSLFQPEIATRLRDNKLENLESATPQYIATANIGCQEHLQGGTDTPVVHWIELLGTVPGA